MLLKRGTKNGTKTGAERTLKGNKRDSRKTHFMNDQHASPMRNRRQKLGVNVKFFRITAIELSATNIL